MVSYLHSIATMAVFLAICEIFLYLALNNGVTLKCHPRVSCLNDYRQNNDFFRGIARNLIWGYTF